MKVLYWVIPKILIWAALIAGFCYDIEGARNVMIGWITAMTFLQVFFGRGSDYLKTLKERGRRVPKEWSIANVVVTCLFLFWFGEYWIAALVFIDFTSCEVSLAMAEKEVA